MGGGGCNRLKKSKYFSSKFHFFQTKFIPLATPGPLASYAYSCRREVIFNLIDIQEMLFSVKYYMHEPKHYKEFIYFSNMGSI